MRHRLLRSTSIGLLAFVAASCADSSAPSPRRAGITLAPRFSAADAGIFRSLGVFELTVDNVEVVIRRPGTDGRPLLDTTVAFPVTATQIAIEVEVQLSAQEERLEAQIGLRAGDLVLFSGSQLLTARAGGASTTDGPVELAYVGPGAQTRKVSLSTSSLGTYVGGSVALVAKATDAQGLVVSNVPISWSSTNTASAMVDAQGVITGLGAGNAYIIARSANGYADTASLRVTTPPTRLLLVAGDAQRGTVAELLPGSFSVQALDAAGGGVPGATIVFAVTGGGGAVDQPSVATDDKGIASVKLTLGTKAGDNAWVARFGSLQPLVVHATGLADIPVNVSTVSGDKQSGTAGLKLPNPLVVLVTDAYANPVAGAVVDWISQSAGGKPVASTTSTLDGTASLDYLLPPLVGPEEVTAKLASSQGSQTTAVFALNVLAGAVTSIRPVPGTELQTVDVCIGALPQPLAVQTVDQFGNASPFEGLAVTFSIDSGAATFGDSQARSAVVTTNALGIATATRYSASTSPLQTVSASAFLPGSGASVTTQFSITATVSTCGNRLPKDSPRLPSTRTVDSVAGRGSGPPG